MKLESFSWVRTYHSGFDPAVRTEDLIRAFGSGRNHQTPLGVTASVEDGDALLASRFFDIQLLHCNAVARLTLSGLELDVPVLGIAGIPTSVHYLLHTSGFCVLRISCLLGELDDERHGISDEPLQDVSGLSNSFASTDSRVICRMGGLTLQMPIRNLMTFFFSVFLVETLDSRARSEFGSDRGERLNAIASKSADENALLRLLTTTAGLPFTVEYPVSFGTHVELSGKESASSVRCLVRNSEVPRVHGELFEPLADDTIWWGIGEGISISFIGDIEESSEARGGLPVPDEEALLALRPGDRIQIIEALALRYGTLLSIQRNTQLEFIQRNKSQVDVSRLASWERSVISTTDDWTFDGRVGRYLTRIESGLDSGQWSRSTLALRVQVNENLSLLQSKLGSASQKASMILGLVFSVVAARGISSLFILAISGGDSETWRNDHVWVTIGIEVSVIVLIGLGVFFWFRRVTGSVPKPWHR